MRLKKVPPSITKTYLDESELKLFDFLAFTPSYAVVAPPLRRRRPVSGKPRLSVVEIVLQLRATLDYGTCPFLQLALCSFEEWSANLHMQILSQTYFYSDIA
jgi:hypothetical protein